MSASQVPWAVACGDEATEFQDAFQDQSAPYVPQDQLDAAEQDAMHEDEDYPMLEEGAEEDDGAEEGQEGELDMEGADGEEGEPDDEDVEAEEEEGDGEGEGEEVEADGHFEGEGQAEEMEEAEGEEGEEEDAEEEDNGMYEGGGNMQPGLGEEGAVYDDPGETLDAEIEEGGAEGMDGQTAEYVPLGP